MIMRQIFNTLINRSLTNDLLKLLDEARPEAEIIFVMIGMDGLINNEKSLIAYYEHWQIKMKLKLSILIIEHENQYRSKMSA